MALMCPECQGTLTIPLSVELGSTDVFDETSLQTAKCSSCSFIGVATYEESRRGGFENEIVHHEVYDLNKSYIESMEQLLEGCKHPKDGQCTCHAHVRLRELYQEIKTKKGKDIVWEPTNKDVLESIYDELDDFMFLV